VAASYRRYHAWMSPRKSQFMCIFRMISIIGVVVLSLETIMGQPLKSFKKLEDVTQVQIKNDIAYSSDKKRSLTNQEFNIETRERKIPRKLIW